MRRQFTFYHPAPRNSWYSFDQSQKDERLSLPWSHPVVLNIGPLDWESSTLTTRPLSTPLTPDEVLLELFSITETALKKLSKVHVTQAHSSMEAKNILEKINLLILYMYICV